MDGWICMTKTVKWGNCVYFTCELAFSLSLLISIWMCCSNGHDALASLLSPPAVVQCHHLRQLGSSITVSHCDSLSAGLSPCWYLSVSDRATPACQDWSLSSPAIRLNTFIKGHKAKPLLWTRQQKIFCYSLCYFLIVFLFVFNYLALFFFILYCWSNTTTTSKSYQSYKLFLSGCVSLNKHGFSLHEIWLLQNWNHWSFLGGCDLIWVC